jgi:hypothetical protein
MQALREHSEEHAATLSALWLCAQHLEEILLDRKVLPFGTFRQLPGCQKIGDVEIRSEMPLYMSLDGSAFDNLEVCLKGRPASPNRLPHACALTSINYGNLHVCDCQADLMRMLTSILCSEYLRSSCCRSWRILRVAVRAA